jgi:hypothetical protein
MPTWNYAFLAYSGRSGSTYLAKQMNDRLPSVTVLPEFRAVEHLAVESVATGDAISCRTVRDILANDVQLAQDAAMHQRLVAHLDALHRPTMSLVEALDELTEVALSTHVGPHPDVVVLQFSRYQYFITRLRPRLGARLQAEIGIVRDPRGVVNSLLKTARAYYRNEDMGRGDPAFCSRRWAREQRQMLTMCDAAPGRIGLIVKYEDMVADLDATLLQVASRLEVPTRLDAAVAAEYAVAPRERGLHPLLDRSPEVSRVDAWRSELPVGQRLAVEVITRDTAARLGYVTTELRSRARLAAAWWSLRSAVFQSRYLVRRIVQHWNNPRRLWRHLRSVVYRTRS